MSNSKEIKVRYHKGDKPSKKFNNKNPRPGVLGQWTNPGVPTEIPSDYITMEGVPYPVMGEDNFGRRQIMMPGANYEFPGASFVTEIPLTRQGGSKLPPHLPEAYQEGGSWLDKYQAEKSVVFESPVAEALRNKYAGSASSGKTSNVSGTPNSLKPQYVTSESSTTNKNINRANIESQIDLNNRYISPETYGAGERFTVDAIEKLKKKHDVDIEYDPGDPFFKIAGLFGSSPGAYYNPFTRTVNYREDFGYEVEPKHPYVTHDILMHEIPHAIQFDRHKSVIGKLGEARKAISGLFMDKESRYETPGTFEYEAHHDIEDKLRKDFDKDWDMYYDSSKRTGGSNNWLKEYK